MSKVFYILHLLIEDMNKCVICSAVKDIAIFLPKIVKNMHHIFCRCQKFNQPLNNWNVSNVKNMYGMFNGASAFNQPICSWDVSIVKYMDDMFNRASSFNQPIGFWNVSSVIGMSGMFLGASSFNQPIGSWDVSSVNDVMYNMFYVMSNLYILYIYTTI